MAGKSRESPLQPGFSHQSLLPRVHGLIHSTQAFQRIAQPDMDQTRLGCAASRFFVRGKCTCGIRFGQQRISSTMPRPWIVRIQRSSLGKAGQRLSQATVCERLATRFQSLSGCGTMGNLAYTPRSTRKGL